MDLRERQGTAPPVRHPWERARARAVERLLARARLPTAPRVLDVGCGDGYLLSRLGEQLGAATRVGVDPALDEPTRRQLERRDPPIHTVATLGALPAHAFDLALLLDVLEHVEDDLELLIEAASRLVPGGQMLITVPAHPALFGEHDRQLLHLRRYSRRHLSDLVARAGLATLASGSLFASLLVPRGAAHLTERLGARAARLFRRPPSSDAGRARASRRAGVGGWRGGPLLTRTIVVALDCENRLLSTIARAGLPAPGLSHWARCRTP